MLPEEAFRIRPLKPSDEPVLWEMLYHALYVPEGAEPLPRDIVKTPELAHYVQGWGQPGDDGFIAIATVSGQPIGAAWLRLFTGKRRGYGYVDDGTPELAIAVISGHRGGGVGTQLLIRLLESARRHYLAISLSVAQDNPAIRLYERMGFEVVRQVGDSVTMCRSWE
jgi:ribosomal protein S18 acetylase RimI-like enzyme